MKNFSWILTSVPIDDDIIFFVPNPWSKAFNIRDLILSPIRTFTKMFIKCVWHNFWVWCSCYHSGIISWSTLLMQYRLRKVNVVGLVIQWPHSHCPLRAGTQCQFSTSFSVWQSQISLLLWCASRARIWGAALGNRTCVNEYAGGSEWGRVGLMVFTVW